MKSGKEGSLNLIIFISSKQVLHPKRQRTLKGNFDIREDDRIFLGYFRNSHAFCVFHKHIGDVIESVNIIVEDVEHKSVPRNPVIRMFMILQTQLIHNVINSQQRMIPIPLLISMKLMFKQLLNL